VRAGGEIREDEARAAAERAGEARGPDDRGGEVAVLGIARARGERDGGAGEEGLAVGWRRDLDRGRDVRVAPFRDAQKELLPRLAGESSARGWPELGLRLCLGFNTARKRARERVQGREVRRR
jgi:hypothetical protein